MTKVLDNQNKKKQTNYLYNYLLKRRKGEKKRREKYSSLNTIHQLNLTIPPNRDGGSNT